MRTRLFAALLLGLTLALGASFFVLPSLGHGVFVSPDETANAVTALRLLPDTALADFPWLHPRSFVFHAGRLAPVGFLGMPLIIGMLASLLGPWMLVLVTPLLALSVAIPLTSFTSRWGKKSQIAAVVAWLTFPTVILYANRGLFPNLPVICCTIWAAWLIWKTEKRGLFILAGVLAGFALIIRPVEAVWVLPWLGFALLLKLKHANQREKIRVVLPTVLACAAVCLLGTVVAHQVYGSWFVAGYQLRDPVIQQAVASSTPPVIVERASVSWFETWPFGFHPRNVWFNVKSYLILYLLPWFLLVLAAAATVAREKKWRMPLLLAAYTVAVLSMIYGEALYQDHVGVMNQVTLANSFLRYLLPLSVIAVASLAWLAHWIPTKLPRAGKYLVVALVFFVAGWGIWTAFARDDEGLLQTRQELAKYIQIRERAQTLIPSDAIIASDRSDKIFFPVWTHVVSPMPPKEQLREVMTSTKKPLALYLRTLTPEQLEAWKSAGVILTPVLPTGNETLYLASVL